MITYIIAKSQPLAMRYAVDENLHNVKYLESSAQLRGQFKFDFVVGYGWRERDDLLEIVDQIKVSLRGQDNEDKSINFAHIVARELGLPTDNLRKLRCISNK